MPGHLEQKVEHFLRSLPKELRRGFVPLVMESAPTAPAEQRSREADDARIDITLTNGRRMTIPVSLAPSHLAALLAVTFLSNGRLVASFIFTAVPAAGAGAALLP